MTGEGILDAVLSELGVGFLPSINRLKRMNRLIQVSKRLLYRQSMLLILQRLAYKRKGVFGKSDLLVGVGEVLEERLLPPFESLLKGGEVWLSGIL